MTLEATIGLLGTATSLTGLVWPESRGREPARMRILIVFAVLGLLVWANASLQQRRLERASARLIAEAETPMSADHLFERMPQRMLRSLFDDALQQATERGMMDQRMIDMRASDGTPVRVRVYFRSYLAELNASNSPYPHQPETASAASHP